MTPMALLIMDVQQGIVERFARDAGYLDRLAMAITAARSAGVAVTYVTVAFRPGYPEVCERNKSFSAIAGTGRFTDGDPGMQITRSSCRGLWPGPRATVQITCYSSLSRAAVGDVTPGDLRRRRARRSH
jgi:hypothetical protein